MKEIFTKYSIRTHLDERAKNALNNTFNWLVTEGHIENGPNWYEKKNNGYNRHSSNLYHVDIIYMICTITFIYVDFNV